MERNWYNPNKRRASKKAIRKNRPHKEVMKQEEITDMTPAYEEENSFDCWEGLGDRQVEELDNFGSGVMFDEMNDMDYSDSDDDYNYPDVSELKRLWREKEEKRMRRGR